MPQNRWLSWLSPLLLVVLWEGAVQFGLLNRIFIPPPSEVVVALAKGLADGTMAADVLISSERIALGFLLGAIPATLLGIWSGLNRTVYLLVRPLATMLYPVPKIALLPLVIVVLGIGELSKIATVAISVFLMVVIHTIGGVLQIDQRYFEVGRVYGANQRTLFRTVAFPASLPAIIEGWKLAMGFALTLIVGVEFVGASNGIGYRIWQSYELYSIADMMASVCVIAALGWILTIGLDEVERLVVPWRHTVKESRMPLLKKWWGAVRPWSYTAAIIPVLLGGAIAAQEGGLNWLWLALALIGSIAIQGGTNLMNDYYDYKKGTDTPAVKGTGGALLRGEMTPQQIFWAGILAFAVGSAIGLYFVYETGPFIFWLGLCSVAVGYFYTAGPFALAYVGLGEIAVFIFMGPVMVLGSYYLQQPVIAWPAIWASLPVAFVVAAILHANNLRDIDTDILNNKRTLATMLGRAGARVEFYVLVGGAFISVLVLIAVGLAPWPTVVCFAMAPLAWRLMRTAATEVAAEKLHPVLRGSAVLHMRFGLLYVLGWVIAVWV
ncbi:MAG: 1,4-dihydroxy-2-naphthoate octaprenyltransferase [Chloroflexota bacterium]|jgi:1,4-dihydroxy-2-naphthoate octaprenyltransferase